MPPRTDPKHQSIWTASPVMRLYEVVRWGNDTDGGDGPDTCYLVIATDHATAARLAAQRREHADVIYELGVSIGTSTPPGRILRGPYIESAYNPASVPAWSWEDHLRTWISTPACHDGNGVARSAYPDGSPAASIGYAKSRLNGPAERWYPGGTPLSHEVFAHGRPLGVHQWWYADGRPARRIEWTYTSRDDVEVTTTTWDEHGEVLEHETTATRIR